MPILSAKYSASGKEFVVIIIILSSFLFFIISQNFFFDSTSIPMVGSSNKMMEESSISANITHNFLFCPSDKMWHGQSLLSNKSNSFNKLFISA